MSKLNEQDKDPFGFITDSACLDNYSSIFVGSRTIAYKQHQKYLKYIKHMERKLGAAFKLEVVESNFLNLISVLSFNTCVSLDII